MRSRTRKLGIALGLWLAAAGVGAAGIRTAQASEAGADGLPPETAARAALEAAPGVRAARESIATGEAQAQRLRSGPYEWEAAVTTQRRTDPNGFSTDEQQYELARRLRLPGKWAVDRQMGELQRHIGETSYADAWHEAGRTLLAGWFEVLRQSRRAQQLGAQRAIAARAVETIGRRIASGDAPRVDGQLAEAEQQRLAARELDAARAAELARIELAARYPDLALELPARLDPPPLPAGDDAEWVRHIVGHNHEVELADGRSDLAQAASRRAAQDRVPDPLVGVQYSDNFDGNRRVLGVRVAVPLGYGLRSAEAAQARSNARRSTAEAESVRLRVAGDARAAVLALRTTDLRWQRLTQAAEQAQAAANAVSRGYELGELPIATLLAAQRQAAEAAEEAELALVDRLEAHARLRLDSHELWALAEPEH